MNLKRQTLFKLGAWPLWLAWRDVILTRGAVATSLGALMAHSPSLHAQALEAESEEFRQMFQDLTAGAVVQAQRVHLNVPRLADNGHSVALKLRVDTLQTEQEHVKRLVILSCRNPRPLIASYKFKPMQTPLNLSTRIRLNGSQRIWVLAQLNDGSWWGQHAQVEVTESACLDATL